jgi:hypothetical protein
MAHRPQAVALRVEHVNVRRGTNEESKVAVDVKLSVEDLSAKCAGAVLRSNTEEEILDAFFTSDDDQGPRFLGLTSIPIDEFWEGQHQIKISGGGKLRVAKLHKVLLAPRAKGLFSCSFTVTIEEPPENFIEQIANKLHTSCAVKLEQEQDLGLQQKPADKDRKPGAVKKTEPQQQTLQ